jgi:predicted DsbA family dithiol-disulfide isomerase
MKITMASDVVSPFCWMATHQVEQAMASFPDVDFELDLMPFQVTPGLPDGYTFQLYQREHMTRTFGSMAAVKDMLNQVTAMGAGYGCHFNLDQLTGWPNSRRAHGLWSLGLTGQQRWDLHRDICQAHFEYCRNLNDLAVLVDIGERHGLDADLVGEQLRDDAYLGTIERRIQATRTLGINSVPDILLNGSHAVSGARGRHELVGHIKAALAG